MSRVSPAGRFQTPNKLLWGGVSRECEADKRVCERRPLAFLALDIADCSYWFERCGLVSYAGEA